tara:strand:+ start:4699 stop:4989 length:291 start_codon:yes stop_codon:yes gene_type:complete
MFRVLKKKRERRKNKGKPFCVFFPQKRKRALLCRQLSFFPRRAPTLREEAALSEDQKKKKKRIRVDDDDAEEEEEEKAEEEGEESHVQVVQGVCGF